MELPNAPERRIGRRKLLDPLRIEWRVPESRRRRRKDAAQTAWLRDLSVTGLSVEAPADEALLVGHRVRIGLEGQHGTVVIRRIDPTSSEWTLRYGVEFVSLDPGLTDMLRRILEEDRPAGLEQLWTKAR